MNTFNKKSLYAALAGISALGVTGAAEAVSVNPDGLGQALIYPYYTVRDRVALASYNTLLSVVNSTASAKAVKVRFLEGKNSREVLDFNLYLSAKDVWVAAVVPTATGAGIYTPDKSCTQPTVSSSPSSPTPFVNFAYTGSAADGADASLDRTREGYIEIIEMGDIYTGSVTYDAITHVAGVPDCAPLSSASADTVAGSGGLFGTSALINVFSGDAYGVDAIALDGFSTTPLWFAPGSILPNLANVNPKISVVTNKNTTYVTDWAATTNPIDAVSAVFMHNAVHNEFVLDTVVQGKTDWVVTMPTKYSYIATGPGNNAGRLFQRNFNGNSGSCDDVVLTSYDREERTVSSPGTFSPPPPTVTDAICWEANVITLNGGNILGSKNLQNIPTSFQNGWAAVAFPLIGTAGSPTAKHVLYGGASTTATITGTTIATGTLAATTFAGLPVVGFAVQSYNNGVLSVQAGASGALSLVQSNYGVNFNHKTTRVIQ
jgi:hypothetical protein